MRLPRAVRWEGGAGFFMSVLLAACASSPADDLTRAQTDLIRLEQQGAEAYLPERILAVRESIRLAREHIQRNRFEQAGKSLRLARAALDTCAAALVDLRSHAKQRSEMQLSQLQSGLDSLAALLKAMPRQSYLDQNLYGLHSLRLIGMRQEAAAMRLDIEQKDYPMALKKGQLLERRLGKSMAAVLENSSTPVMAVSNGASR